MKAILGGLLIASALVQSATAAPGVTVSDAWMRALPGGLPAGGYFTLRNKTSKTLTLQSASSPACGVLMLHKSDTMGGMATMANVDSIDVRPGGTLEFSPGGPIPEIGNAPDLSAAVFATAPGQAGQPVPVPGGFVLFRVLTRTTPPATTYETQKSEIADTLRGREADRLIRATIQQLRAEKKVEINEELLQSFMPDVKTRG